MPKISDSTIVVTLLIVFAALEWFFIHLSYFTHLS